MDQLRLFLIVIQQDLWLLAYVALGSILGTLVPSTFIALVVSWRAGSRKSLLNPLWIAWSVAASISGMTYLLGWSVARQFFQIMGASPSQIPSLFWPWLAAVSLVVGLVFGYRRAASFLRASHSRESTTPETANQLQPVRITLGSFFVYQLMGLLIIGLWVGSRRDEIAEHYLRAAHYRWQTSLGRFTELNWDPVVTGQWPDHRLHLSVDRRVNVFKESSLELIRSEDHLANLYVWSDGLTDAGLREISAQKHLEHLNIRSAAVTDAGVAELRAAKQLRNIHLHCPELTDQSLEYLSELPNLGMLTIYSPHISASAAEHFEASHPNVYLLIRPPPDQP